MFQTCPLKAQDEESPQIKLQALNRDEKGSSLGNESLSPTKRRIRLKVERVHQHIWNPRYSGGEWTISNPIFEIDNTLKIIPRWNGHGSWKAGKAYHWVFNSYSSQVVLGESTINPHTQQSTLSQLSPARTKDISNSARDNSAQYSHFSGAQENR